MITASDQHQKLLYQPTNNRVYELSVREIEIIKLIAIEYSNKDIAANLYISVGTVETHRRNIFMKMGAKNMAGLIHRAYQCGILKVGSC